MTYSLKLPPTIIPKDAPNNKAILNNKFAIDMLTGAQNPKSMDRAVRVGELMDTGLFELNAAGILVPIAAADSPITTPGRNKLINGDFRFWQRAAGAGAAAARRYVADRWETWSVGSTTQVDRLSMQGNSVVRPLPRYAQRVIVGSVAGANNFAFTRQYVEDVRNLSNGKVTVSFWVWSDVASEIGVSFDQNFGTDVGASATVLVPGQKSATGPTWKKVRLTFALPEVWSKTITANSALILYLWFDAGSSNSARAGGIGQRSATYWVTGVQLENGEAPSPFDERSDALELELCQRYFEKTYNVDVQPGTVTSEGRVAVGNAALVSGLQYHTCLFKVRKRANPAITVWAANNSPASGTVAQDDGSLAASPTVRFPSQIGFEISWSNTAGRWGGFFHHTADVEF